MPRRPRSRSGPGFFHVLNRSVGREPLFQRPADYRAFLAVLNEGLTRHPVRLIAYCLLSDHWQLVLGPTDSGRLLRLMDWVTTTHAMRWHEHRSTSGNGRVYQGRFKCVSVLEAEELLRVCRYVERNALCAGLVRRAQDWPWASLSERLRPERGVPLVSTPFLENDGWITYVNAALRPSERLCDGAETPRRFAAVPQGVDRPVSIFRAHHENQAHAHVERAKHLPVVETARVLQPAKQWRHRPAAPVE